MPIFYFPHSVPGSALRIRDNTAVLNSIGFKIRSVLILSVSLNEMLNLSKIPVLDDNTNFIRLLTKLKE